MQTETQVAEEPVYIPDPNLKAVIEAKLGVKNPTPTAMLKLKKLSTFSPCLQQSKLELQSRSITDLTGLGYATNLTELTLIGNHLTSLPPEIGNLTRLRTLYFIENQLISLPPEIVNLTNLTEFGLCANQLTSLPPEIENLTELSVLILLRNKLTLLPPEIGKLTKLRILYLNENRLSSLPDEIANLVYLEYLDLSGNPLSEAFYQEQLPLLKAQLPKTEIILD